MQPVKPHLLLAADPITEKKSHGSVNALVLSEALPSACHDTNLTGGKLCFQACDRPYRNRQSRGHFWDVWRSWAPVATVPQAPILHELPAFGSWSRV
jgi:hypothetical protein